MSSSHAGLPFPRRIFAVFAVSAGSLMLMIDVSIANIVLPTLSAELGVASSDAVIVVTAYQLILAMSLMPLAALGARIGLPDRLSPLGFGPRALRRIARRAAADPASLTNPRHATEADYLGLLEAAM